MGDRSYKKINRTRQPILDGKMFLIGSWLLTGCEY